MARINNDGRPDMSLLSRAAPQIPVAGGGNGKSAGAAFVTLETPEDRLSALQEDLGMMLAQTARRKDVERARPRSCDESEQILEEDRDQRLASLARLCRTGYRDLREFLRQARRLFPDDSDLVLALRARRRLSERAASGLGTPDADATATLFHPADGALATTDTRFLGDALENVFREGDPRHIKAGINVGEGARRYGERLHLQAPVMRNLYRDFLDFADDLPVLYDDWIERFDFEQRRGIAQFVGSMLIADRRALDPSCTHVVFSSLFAQGNVLRMMATAEQAFRQLVPRENDGAAASSLERAMAGLLTTVMRDPRQTTLAVGALLAYADNLSARERFIQRIYATFAGLPIALYPDVASRHVVLSAVLGLATPCF